MRITLFAAFFLLWFPYSLSASLTGRIDSLRIELSKEKVDTNRILLLNTLGHLYLEANVENVLPVLTEMEALSDRTNFQKGHVQAMVLMGKVYGKRGNHLQELDLLQSALSESEEINDSNLIASVERSLAFAYFASDKPQLARAHLERAGTIQLQRKSPILPRHFSDLAILYTRLGDTLQAKRLYQQSIDAAHTQGIPTRAVFGHANLGHLHKLTGNYSEALVHLSKALEILNKEGTKGGLAFVHAVKGGCHKELGQFDLALHHHLESFKAAREQQALETSSWAAQDVSLAYEALGDHQMALHYARIHADLMDSIRDGREESRVMEVESEFQQERRVKEVERESMLREVEAVREWNRLLGWTSGLGIGVVALLGLVFFVTVRSRARRRANEALEDTVKERTEALSQANESLQREVMDRVRSERELSTFVYRSSHDLRGPLTSIQGLIYISRGLAMNPELQRNLGFIAKKTDQLDEILGLLMEQVGIGEMDLEVVEFDVEREWQLVLADLELVEGWEQVYFSFRAEPNVIWMGVPKAVRSILFNLVSNAIVFREMHRDDTRCEVRISERDGGMLMEVRDNAAGMSPEVLVRAKEMFFKGTMQGKGAGLGLFAVDKLVRQLGGSLTIESELGEGTLVKVWLPQ